MESPNKKSPSVWFNELRGLLTLIFQKVSKLVDRVLFDNKTIGLLLCKGKDEVVAQYALTGYDQPIGISDYQLSKAIPENLKSILPSIEEVEEELTSFLDKDNNPQN